MADDMNPTLGRPATPGWLQEIEDEERQAEEEARERASQEPVEPLESEVPAEPVETPPQPEVPDPGVGGEEAPDPALDSGGPEPSASQEPPVELPAEPELILGRYKDPTELIPAYQQLRELQQRTGQEKNEYQRRVTELEQQIAQLQSSATLVPSVPQGFTPEQISMAEAQGMDEQTLRLVQQLAAQEADRRTQALQAQMQQQEQQRLAEQQAAYQQQQREATIVEFRRRHPEIQPNSEDDERHAVMYQTIAGDPNLIPEGTDAFTPSVLEAAWEATNDPDFYQVIRANPAYIDTDEGVAFAKMQATLLKATRNGLPQQAPQETQAPRTPAVESGGQGAPPQSGGKPLDDYDKMMQSQKEPKKLSI